MRENHLSVPTKHKPNGITKADREAQKSDNKIKRDFTADQLFVKGVTDIRTPSLSQAITLKKLSQSGDLDTERIVRILSQDKPNQKEKVSFSYEEIRKYFPENYSVGDIQRYILHLIATDYNRHRDRGKGGDAR